MTIYNQTSLFSKVEQIASPTFEIIGITKDEEAKLIIAYQFYLHALGNVVIANTTIGICFISFFENEKDAFFSLQEVFKGVELQQKSTELQEIAFNYLTKGNTENRKLTFHLKGTNFQLSVWNELLKIAISTTQNYLEIALKLGKPKASRAVGTAIGQNPIAILIPCHRVIQKSGKISGYRWGIERKRKLLLAEQE